VIYNLVVGAEAVMLALLQSCLLAAMGFPLTRRVEKPALRIASAFVVGAGINSAILGSLSALVSTAAALRVSIATGAIASIFAAGDAKRVMTAVLADAAALYRRFPLARFAAPPVIVLYLIDAFAPPRDGDVMRYHLAHIRQILTDGRWLPIADYHYALPFGWTFNYLLFERVGVPEAANVLNAVAILLLVLVTATALPLLHSRRSAAAVALLFVLHPAVLKAGTTAFADAYGMLAVFVAAVLIIQSREARSLGILFLAGVVSWIGVQSRYQLIGFGLSATLAFVLTCDSSDRVKSLGVFASGALAALVIASPFYLMNWHAFGNPIWPFMEGGGRASSYADVVAALYHHSQTGPRSLGAYQWGLERLVTYRDVFPIPIIVLLVAAFGWRLRRLDVRPALFMLTGFAILWLALQPRLYPRFILYFLPLAVVVGIPLLDQTAGIVRKWLKPVVLYSAALLFAADIAYSADSLRYFAAGDTAAYHRYTWYYPVYAWVNEHTPRDARFIVIVWSGYSYYLDRSYRRADPWLSGDIDWKAVHGAEARDSLLRKRNVDYVIYDDRDWSNFLGGPELMSSIKDAMRVGTLKPVRKFRQQLYTSRMSQVYTESDVFLLQRAGAAGQR
jgi:hypothetical protein